MASTVPIVRSLTFAFIAKPFRYLELIRTRTSYARRQRYPAEGPSPFDTMARQVHSRIFSPRYLRASAATCVRAAAQPLASLRPVTSTFRGAQRTSCAEATPPGDSRVAAAESISNVRLQQAIVRTHPFAVVDGGKAFPDRAECLSFTSEKRLKLLSRDSENLE
ncbi:hypothetical protein [Tsuneonella suprasediminis]|uniref:hypothetical protein n=1 Tax=Tsuneonella suprasediminis TaxID=2306996 RepID=UPI002F93E704